MRETWAKEPFAALAIHALNGERRGFSDCTLRWSWKLEMACWKYQIFTRPVRFGRTDMSAAEWAAQLGLWLILVLAIAIVLFRIVHASVNLGALQRRIALLATTSLKNRIDNITLFGFFHPYS